MTNEQTRQEKIYTLKTEFGTYKIAKSTFITGYSGFNKYESFKFDLEKMNKLED